MRRFGTKSNKNKCSVKTVTNYIKYHISVTAVCRQTEMTDLLKRGQKNMYPFCSVRLYRFLTIEMTIKVKFEVSTSAQ